MRMRSEPRGPLAKFRLRRVVGEPGPDVEGCLSGGVVRFARHCRFIGEKLMDDAVLLLPGADGEAIGAAFDRSLRHSSIRLKGEAGLFG